jgi:putative PEP-CTERM system histidine kinase
MSDLAAGSLLHALCAVAYLVLGVLVLLRRTTRTVWFLAAACFATSLWAGSVALAGGTDSVNALLETLRSGAWAIFMVHLLRGVIQEHRNLPRWALAAPILALMLASVALDLPLLLGAWQMWLANVGWLTQGQRIVRILLAVAGLLLVENFYRNASRQSRWHINLLTIGIGALFVYDIVLYADAALYKRVSSSLFVARASVSTLAAPVIALSVARNRRWLSDIRLSQNIVLHSSTLLISGIFLLAIGVTGEVLRNTGVTWGPVLEITLVFGAIVLVAIIFTSGRARSKLRVFLVQNFFAYRYDYRKVWANFIDTLSNPSFSGEQLRVRVIRAVADTVDSPAGSLWLRDNDDTAFTQVATWNLPRDGAPVEAEFATAFRDGQWVVMLNEGTDDGPVPQALAQTQRAWLAVPIGHLGRLLGFVLLTEPRAAMSLNWENYQLLRIVSRQIASYLAEEQAARALVEARQLQAYGQRFAFVVHDIKNLVSQLSMVVSNGERHADDPEFQRDVLETVRHSVQSMNKLLAQLRASRESEPVETSVPVAVVREALKAWRPRKPLDVQFVADDKAERVRIARDALDSALRHLLDNAAEVSPPNGSIVIEVRHAADKVIIDISDKGAGMQAEFITNQLFQPFRSTKSDGYGIGAYQTRELVRAAHGDLLVLSEPGKGTTMRIVLPIEATSVLSSEPRKMIKVAS